MEFIPDSVCKPYRGIDPAIGPKGKFVDKMPILLTIVQ